MADVLVPEVVDSPHIGGQNIKLLPLVSELFILTKDRRVVRLGDVLNYAQLDFIEECEHQLRTRGQIRIAVLKARQIGISTIIEAIAFVLSMAFEDFNSMVISHEDKSAGAILAMSKRYWSTYLWKEFHDEKYNGQKHLAWTNGSDIDIATAKNVDAGRSRTLQFLHASEVAFWPDPDTLMTGLNQSVPTYGLNCIFVESTANGVGNFFHKTCNAAMRGESEYKFKFYPWHEHPEYTAAFLPPGQADTYLDLGALDEEELRLRHHYGIDDARLIWRRWAITNRCQGSIDRFHQEYPTTPHEAFISTGRNVFPLPDLLAHYEPMEGRRGRLLRKGQRVTFVDDPNGYLTVFAEPSSDRDWGVYLAGGDPTHTTAGDYACIQVINRRTLEQVAVYRRKIDPINFGKDMQLVGSYYNTAELAPEKEGPGYATIGCIVGDNYPLVYATVNVAKMQGKPTTDVYGWSTNSQTKHLAISHLLKAVTDKLVAIGGQTYGLLIHDETTLLEMRDYITSGDGQRYENNDGSEYDDGVMALAIAMTVHNIEPPPGAYEEDAAHRPPRRIGPVTAGITSGKARVIDNRPRDERTTPSRPVGPELLDEPLVGDTDTDDLFDEPSVPWEAWGVPREDL